MQAPAEPVLSTSAQPGLASRAQDLADTAVVERLSDLSPTIREFELRPLGGTRSWAPGSHLTVGVGADNSQTRTYSLVGLPQAQGYRIAVKRLTPGRGGSRFMWSLVPGDRIAIGRPRNDFSVPLAASRILLVAGGIGITPLLGMAQMLAAKGADVDMHYAASSPEELVYLPALREALGNRLRTFTRAEGQRLDLDTEVAALPPDAYLLVCGPLRLLNAVRGAWTQSGRPVNRLRFETFGTTGNRPEEPFWIEVDGMNPRIQVDVDRSMLDALNVAGIETLYDCLRGECGLCAVDILRVEGEVDHRDVFLSESEKLANRRICTCVSRVTGGGVVIDSGFREDG